MLVFRGVTSQSLTWNLKIIPSKRKLIFNTILFGFHVKLRMVKKTSYRFLLRLQTRNSRVDAPHRNGFSLDPCAGMWCGISSLHARAKLIIRRISVGFFEASQVSLVVAGWVWPWCCQRQYLVIIYIYISKHMMYTLCICWCYCRILVTTLLCGYPGFLLRKV